MKSLSFIVSILLFGFASVATEISLSPGSSATITASETTTVSCSGTQTGQGITCQIFKSGADIPGIGNCNYNLCSATVQFGFTVNWRGHNSSSNAVNWCNKELGN